MNLTAIKKTLIEKELLKLLPYETSKYLNWDFVWEEGNLYCFNAIKCHDKKRNFLGYSHFRLKFESCKPMTDFSILFIGALSKKIAQKCFLRQMLQDKLLNALPEGENMLGLVVKTNLLQKLPFKAP